MRRRSSCRNYQHTIPCISLLQHLLSYNFDLTPLILSATADPTGVSRAPDLSSFSLLPPPYPHLSCYPPPLLPNQDMAPNDSYNTSKEPLPMTSLPGRYNLGPPLTVSTVATVAAFAAPLESGPGHSADDGPDRLWIGYSERPSNINF